MKKQIYEQLVSMSSALLTDEHDVIANLANLSALLYDQLEQINWAGFYLYKNDELILGPFQGKVACVHIPLGKGVCGTCASTKKVQIVTNVHEFVGHIACDSASQSEIVLPIMVNDTFIGVLDIDSPILARFDDVDAYYLQQIVKILEASIS